MATRPVRYYRIYGHVETMANAVAEGVRRVDGDTAGRPGNQHHFISAGGSRQPS